MNIVNSVLFMLIIGGFALFGLILPDKGISVTEHKNLEKLPEFSAEAAADEEQSVEPSDADNFDDFDEIPDFLKDEDIKEYK